MKTVAIIQARMGSTRLPGKVLMDLAGEPMLARVVNRVHRANTIDEVVVATTTLQRDDVIAELCAARNWSCFRGSEEDVLDRYFQAALMFQADTVVRITSDCPLIDPDVIDEVVRAYTSDPNLDYVSNTVPTRTFPRGLDTEVFGFELLKRLRREDQNHVSREHVTLYVHTHQSLFQLGGVSNAQDLSASRWTVDTTEDLLLLRKIYDHFGQDRFSWKQVISLLEAHRDWQLLNAHIQQKPVN